MTAKTSAPGKHHRRDGPDRQHRSVVGNSYGEAPGDSESPGDASSTYDATLIGDEDVRDVDGVQQVSDSSES
jgi:hypothetical protein